MNRGMVLNEDMLILEDESVPLTESEELVAIKVKNVENSLGFELKKGSIVDIYASSRISELKKIANLESVESFSNESPNGYITIKILDKVKVERCLDSEGNNVKASSVIDIVVLKVEKSMALKIINLKNYCDFSLGIVN